MKTGNTQKVAEALKEQLQTQSINLESISDAEKLDFWGKNPADLYVLGTGIYADRINQQVSHLVDKSPPPKGTKFALFATWIGRGNSGPDTLDKLKKKTGTMWGGHPKSVFFMFWKNGGF